MRVASLRKILRKNRDPAQRLTTVLDQSLACYKPLTIQPILCCTPGNTSGLPRESLVPMRHECTDNQVAEERGRTRVDALGQRLPRLVERIVYLLLKLTNGIARRHALGTMD